MTTPPISAVDDTAVDWFVLLQDPSATEDQFMAFRDWLEASPDHRTAYDRVERLWATLDGAQPAAVQPFQPRRSFTARAKTRRLALGTGAAAAIAAGFAAVLVLPQVMAPAHIDTYTTAKGQRREVTLADGSRITLNSGSEVRVQLGRKSREATLVTGEALFDVAHDPSRPFQATAGDEQIRDIGTAFNIRKNDSRVTVTVLRGIVDIHPQTGSVTRLVQGDELKRTIGSAEANPSKVDAEEVAGWRTGRLVYRDQPLSEVASDLNRYLPTPISADPKAGALRFSGVLQLDKEDLMVSRLERLMPVRAKTTATGVRFTTQN